MPQIAHRHHHPVGRGSGEGAEFVECVVGDFAAAFLNFERQYGAMPAAVATGARCTDGAANLRETPT